MASEPSKALDAQGSIALKHGEPVVDSDNPWSDDLLARRDVSQRLTSLVSTQELPLTISLHGQWGTGKTFLLKRWQKDLETQGFSSIYFNAWEDDFCDDPFLAILGQLYDYFKETGLKEMARQAVEIAMPLIRENLLGMVKATTGLTVKVDNQIQGSKSLLDAYLEQASSKAKVRAHLVELSQEVADNTGHPLVFIIDELDRCRPTFAIELLERVKHIFDVPNLVFVFGVNRDELSKSLSSVYGDINTDVYLRRFFDFEFNLSEADSQGFTRHMMGKFQLGQAFERIMHAGPIHVYDHYDCLTALPDLWSALNFSLTDIDYGTRLLALLVRNIPSGGFPHPFLLAILMTMKFKKPEFYDSLITGDFRTSEIMDYIDEESRQGLTKVAISRHLDRSEGFLYCADNANATGRADGAAAFAELTQVMDDRSGTEFRVISRRAQNADQHQIDRMRQAIIQGRQLGIDGRVIRHLAALIDTHQTELRR